MLVSLRVLMSINLTDFPIIIVSSFQGIEAIIVPAIRSMMSKYISKDEQGVAII